MNDYISRDEMIEQTKARIVWGAPKFNTGLKTAIEVATSIPAADVVEVRHGRWILNDDESVAFCSECDCAIPTKWGKDMTWLWCPECGLKMDGGQDDV